MADETPPKKVVIGGRTYYPELTRSDIWWTIRNLQLTIPGMKERVAVFPGATTAEAAEFGAAGPPVAGLSSDLGDPAREPEAWSPMSWVAQQANAAAGALREVGERVFDAATRAAVDVSGTLGTPQPGEDPAMTEQREASMASLGETIRNSPMARAAERVFGPRPADVAGYVTLADGTQIPVAKYRDTQAAGERAQTDRIAAALNRGNYDLAIQRSREAVERAKLEVGADQWERMFALEQRRAALQATAQDQANRARELALEEATSSPAQRALWGRPSTLEKEPRSRKILSIGAGGIQWG